MSIAILTAITAIATGLCTHNVVKLTKEHDNKINELAHEMEEYAKEYKATRQEES